MRGFSGLGSIAAVLLAVLVLLGSIPATAVDRRNGNSWTYDMIAIIEVEDIEVSVNGTLTFEQAESRSISTDTGTYEANVMTLSGKLSGSKYLFGELFVSSNVTMDGLFYETAGGGGTVKEDTHSVISSTIGAGDLAKSVMIERQVVTTHSPPLLSLFEPSGQPGSSWTETSLKRSALTTWENGAQKGTSYSNLTITYDIDAAQNREYVEHSKYAFYAEKITITESSGDHRVLWWSNTPENFVRQEYYHVNSTEPYMTLALKDWHIADSGNVLLFMVGLVSVVLGSVVLAAVIKKYGPRDRRPPPPDPQSIREVHDANIRIVR